MRSESLPAKATEKCMGYTALPEEKVSFDMVSDWQFELPGLVLYIFEEKMSDQWAQTRWMCSYPVWMRNLKLALPLSSPSSSLSRSVSGLGKNSVKSAPCMNANSTSS